MVLSLFQAKPISSCPAFREMSRKNVPGASPTSTQTSFTVFHTFNNCSHTHYIMPPSSPIFSEESDPFLDAEKATPPSPQNVARSLLRRAFHFRIHRINILHCLLPSFLRSRRNGIETSHPAQTAWLDGMRGLASFFVYNRHFASATHPNIQVGYGTDDKNRWIIQLPFFHLVVGGPAMVSLFFMISGYALSRSPLRAIHYQGSPEPCLMRLSSATFRRAARLFLPAVVSTFLVAICISLGLYDRGHLAYNPEDMPGFWEPEPPQWRNDPWNIQFKDWAANTWGFLKVWNPAGHAYDVHLWTLPVEFRCSIILFIALVGFARCKANIRLALLGATLVYCHYTDFWEGWLFFAGSFLAQLKLLQEDGLSASALPTTDQSTPKSDASPRRRQTPYPDALRICLFIIGLFLLSAPDYGYGT